MMVCFKTCCNNGISIRNFEKSKFSTKKQANLPKKQNYPAYKSTLHAPVKHTNIIMGVTVGTMALLTCINLLFAYCKGGNFNIHIWPWLFYLLKKGNQV